MSARSSASRGGGGQAVLLGVHPRLAGQAPLAAHVDVARRIVAHQHHREAGDEPVPRREIRRLGGDPLA